MRVAVVGGGLFGCTAAIALAEKGHEVHLYEKSDKLFGAASGINQYRLHKGYHYPRSPETIRECKSGIRSFKRVFGKSVITSNERYYAIAAKGSKTSAKKYLEVLEANRLPFKIEKPICKELELFIRVKEDCVNPDLLRNQCLIMLAKAGVEVHFNTSPGENLRAAFDQIVVACYAGNNEVLKALGCETQAYQYEVCEKPIFSLERNGESWRTHNYRNFSLVVMDGPFCSLDPFGHTGWHVMGHVEHAIHSRNVGQEPEVSWRMEGYLNSGIVGKPIGSRWRKMKRAATKYMPFLNDSIYQGSMFTVRTVLPKRDKTDERPTIVERVDDQVIRVFSGKLGTAVQASETTLALLESSPHKTRQSAQLAEIPTGHTETICSKRSKARPYSSRHRKAGKVVGSRRKTAAQGSGKSSRTGSGSPQRGRPASSRKVVP